MRPSTATIHLHSIPAAGGAAAPLAAASARPPAATRQCAVLRLTRTLHIPPAPCLRPPIARHTYQAPHRGALGVG